MPAFVLDTSSLMTVLNDEPGTADVLDFLAAARRDEAGSDPARVRILLPFMALMELEYLLIRNVGNEEAWRVASLVRAWPVEITDSSEPWRREAARIKAGFPVSTADAWISSLAILEQARLVHKDPEYDTVGGLEHFRLPYKPKAEGR